VHGVCDARCIFKSTLPDSVLDKLVDGKEVYDCCGAVIITDPAVESYVDLCNCPKDEILGFPVKLFTTLLTQIASRSEKNVVPAPKTEEERSYASS